MTESTPPPPDYQATKPIFAADETQDIGVVRVSVGIPGLLVKRKWTTKNFLPTTVKEVENALIEVAFEENSFTVIVEGTGKLLGKNWALRIRKLHHPIEVAKCRHEVKGGRILVYLKKQTPKSWFPELAEGLDAYEEPSAEDEEAKQPKEKKKKTKKKKKTDEEKKRKKDDEDDEESEGGEDEDEEESESEEEDSDEEDEDRGGAGGQDDDKGPEPMTE